MVPHPILDYRSRSEYEHQERARRRQARTERLRAIFLITFWSTIAIGVITVLVLRALSTTSLFDAPVLSPADLQK